MSRAVCMAWHRYHPHEGTYYREIWEYWLKSLLIWEETFDKLYLVDDFFGFTQEDKDRLTQILGSESRWEIIPQEREGHHWVQFKTAMPHIKERYCLYLDNDVVIYPGFNTTVEGWFKSAEAGIFVTAYDGSGCLNIRQKMQEEFPVLLFMGKASGMVGEVSRMGSYYYIIDKEKVPLIEDFDLSPKQPYLPGTKIPQLNYTTVEGDWSDSYGYFSPQILSLYSQFAEIEDWRFSLVIMDGKITEQSRYGHPSDATYYHIRNGNLGCYLLTTKKYDIEAYKECVRISAPYEALRLLAWFNIYSEGKYEVDIESIATDFGIDLSLWRDYMAEFKRYHNV